MYFVSGLLKIQHLNIKMQNTPKIRMQMNRYDKNMTKIFQVLSSHNYFFYWITLQNTHRILHFCIFGWKYISFKNRFIVSDEFLNICRIKIILTKYLLNHLTKAQGMSCICFVFGCLNVTLTVVYNSLAYSLLPSIHSYLLFQITK